GGAGNGGDRKERKLKAGILQLERPGDEEKQRCDRGGVEQFEPAEEIAAGEQDYGHECGTQDGRPLLDEDDIGHEREQEEKNGPGGGDAELMAKPVEKYGEGTNVKSRDDKHVDASHLLKSDRS